MDSASSFQDENGPSSNNEEFCVKLVEGSKAHRAFLRTLHSLGIPQIRPSSENIRRYKDLWLPLVAEYKGISEEHTNGVFEDVEGTMGPVMDPRVDTAGLVPPPDVAWLWHCHRLAPCLYKDYIVFARLTDRALEANPPFALQYCGHIPNDVSNSVAVIPNTDKINTAAANARALWEKMYPGEPFFFPTDVEHGYSFAMEKNSSAPSRNDVLNGFNLASSAERQCDFLWQISGPRFDEDSFLREGALNYERFLRLRSSTSSGCCQQLIVPTYQIDFIWHTHILSNIEKYDEDCIRITGHTLDHDDSFTDRSEGSDLDVAFVATKQLWQEAYGVSYHAEGGMYRGEPPPEYYSSDYFDPDGPGTGIIEAHAAWASAIGVAPDGTPVFIPAASSNIRFQTQNPNLRRPGYVFGKGSRGVGYYHTSTRDSNTILVKRLAVARDKKKKEVKREAGLIRDMLRSSFGLGKKNEKRAEKKSELAELSIMVTVAEARAQAEYPFGVIGLDEDHPRRADYYSNSGEWLVSSRYLEAASCGGAKVDGGGSACAGGACSAPIYGCKVNGSSTSNAYVQRTTGTASSAIYSRPRKPPNGSRAGSSASGKTRRKVNDFAFFGDSGGDHGCSGGGGCGGGGGGKCDGGGGGGCGGCGGC